MGAYINRRQLLVGAGAGAIGAAAALSSEPIRALASEGEENVEGSWYVKVHITSPDSAKSTFDTLYAFAKGGVFTRVDGRNNGPGVGTWKRAAGGGIVFNAMTFNFNPGVPSLATRSGGVLGDFAAHVDAGGKLVGTFTAHGILGFSNFQRAGTFTGTRIKAVGTPDPA